VIKLQAVILAAGIGTRLKPLTDSLPKCLIQIGKKSILERQIEILQENGIYDIIIVGGHKSELIKNSNFSNSFRFIENKKFRVTNTLYSFKLAMNYIKEDFLCLYGDLIFDPNMIFSLLTEGKKLTLVVGKPLSPNNNHSVIIENEKIKGINLTHNFKDINGQFIGICKFHATCISLIKKFFNDFNIEHISNKEIIHIFDFFINNKIVEISALNSDLNWININDKKRMDMAQKYFS